MTEGDIHLKREVVVTCRSLLLLFGTAVTLAASAGGFVFTRWQRFEDWVNRVNDAVDTVYKIQEAHEKMEKRLADDLRNTAMHCRLGNLPIPWCEDQGHKTPKNLTH